MLLCKALDCFVPPLEDEDIGTVKERLLALAAWYRRAAAEKRSVVIPMRILYGVDENGVEVFETDEAYTARVRTLLCVKKRGRPRALAQQQLVFRLRELLIEKGCNHGAPKSGRPSELVKLAKLVDEMAGGPARHINWQEIAENAADPVWQMRLLFGDGVRIDKHHETEAKRMMHLWTSKPPRRGSRKGMNCSPSPTAPTEMTLLPSGNEPLPHEEEACEKDLKTLDELGRGTPPPLMDP